MAQAPVKVLFIAAWARSGSTILDNVLGEFDGFFSAGELHNLWDLDAIGRRRCGCGRYIDECDVWARILGDAFGDDLDIDQTREWQRKISKVHHTWRLLRWKAARSSSRVIDHYADATARMYRSIAEVTGARVIVDSSKRPTYAALLSRLPGVEPYFVHLVRDPRAVAYSWQRHKEELVVHSPFHSSLRWITWNIAIGSVVRRQPGSVLVRYEDFVARPREVLERITGMVGEFPKVFPLADGDRAVLLSRKHSASGNPNRFKTGKIELREDDEWKRHLKRSDVVVATLISLPSLARYGYPTRPSATSR